jgi:hypothetical protein
MNKTLIRAAAVVNIVAASLIYVACSGDDGKDGKDSCLVQKNASTGLYDITCGGAYVTSISEGGSGPAGQGCTATPFTTGNGGVNIQCGNGEIYPITNGSNGAGGPAGCEVTSILVPSTNDPAINIRCPDQRAATILVCSGGTKAKDGSTGLLLNTEGLYGKCQVDGTISYSGDIAMLSCGGALFDATKEFCQNTIAGESDTAGMFAKIITSGTTERVAVGSYPQGVAIYSATNDYNKATGKTGVNSTILPLCGIPASPATASQTEVGTTHKAGTDFGGETVVAAQTVYNGNQVCARNLIYKIGAGVGYITSGADAGKPVAGGIYDNDPKNPISEAWQVVSKNQCLADISYDVGLNGNILGDNPGSSASGPINGFRWVTNGTNVQPTRLTRPCTFAGANVVVQANTPPLTVCPDDKQTYSLDDMRCVDRLSECLYHSTVDNTCLASTDRITIQNSLISTGDSAILNGSRSGTGTIADPYFYPVTRATKGVLSTKVGSRFGANNSSRGILSPGGNLWSAPCVTQTRSYFYAINDANLTNKAFKENIVASSGNTYNIQMQPPKCENLTPKSPTDPSPTQPRVAFEDAFACLNGSLSLDVDIRYNGEDWDKPLYCVLGTYGADKYCAVSGTGINISTCKGTNTGADPLTNPLTDAKKSGGDVSSVLNFTWSNGICKVTGAAVGSTSAEPEGTRGDCQNMDGLSRKVATPRVVPGTIRGIWNTAANNTASGGSTEGGCEVYNDDATTDAITQESCEGINALTYGLSNPVLGNITAYWYSSITSGKSDGGGGCIVVSDHNQSIKEASTCSQITGASQTLYPAAVIDNASFYWVQ